MKSKSQTYEKELLELKDMLATERIDHISSIIKYQFGIECNWFFNPEENEYTIYLEDEIEDVSFHHDYSEEDLINCDVTEQAYFLRRWLNTCISLECIRAYENEMAESSGEKVVSIRR